MTTPTAMPEPDLEALTEDEPDTLVPLTLADRCCACASGTSQAFVRVTLRDLNDQVGELLFCGHHYTQHEAALAGRPSLISVQDERSRINDKPSPSAAPED